MFNWEARRDSVMEVAWLTEDQATISVENNGEEIVSGGGGGIQGWDTKAAK